MSSFNVAKLFSVEGQVIVITGAGSGLGESMAVGYAVNGASKVFILGRRQASLDKVAARSGVIIPIVCDITSKDSLFAAASKIASQTPFINVLIANAGVGGPVTSMGSFAESVPDLTTLQADLWATNKPEFNHMIDVTVTSAFYTFVAFINLLGAGNSHPASVGSTGYMQSQFIGVTSVAGLSRADEMSLLYGSAKAGLGHLVNEISTNYAKYGIRANTIVPGFFVTEMTSALVGNDDRSIPGSLPKESFPATRSGAPEDIAGAALFLASRAGGYVNGTVLVVDGGQLSQLPGSN